MERSVGGARIACWLVATIPYVTYSGGQDPGERDQETISIGELIDRFEVSPDGEERREYLVRIDEHLASMPGEARADFELRLAIHFRDRGSYRAVEYYERAMASAPDDPKPVLEAARYWRLYRGARGDVARSWKLYARAKKLIEARRGRLGSDDKDDRETARREHLNHQQEQVVREEVELFKRDGLVIPISGDEEEARSLALRSFAEWGDFSSSFHDLTSATQRIRQLDARFDSHELLRERARFVQGGRLRLRNGVYPWLDLSWSAISDERAISNDSVDVDFFDLEHSEWEAGIEDTHPAGVFGDLLWSIRYARGDIQREVDEDTERVTLSGVWTRNIGPVKADVELLRAWGQIDSGTGSKDDDEWFAANFDFTYYPFSRRKSELVAPRGYILSGGFVRNRREFGDFVTQFRDVTYAGLEAKEVLPRSDATVLGNYFKTDVEGTSVQDSNSFEANLVLVHRLVDRVNELRPPRASRPVNLAQWGLSLRLFDERALDGPDDFESRGFVLGSFLELFSGPGGRSTVFLETAYEWRDYHVLDSEQSLLRFALRLGL